MYAKLEISGIIEVVTGMHIGGSSAFAAIGAVDSPVIKDMRTNLPMIPGSSLKGKLRTLLAKKYNAAVVEPDNDAECITDIFGCAKKGNVKPGRILFSDMVMSNWEALKEQGLMNRTEIKFENNIKRSTAVANPRQIERVIRGSEFPMSLVYEISGQDLKDGEDVAEKVIREISLLAEGFKLLEYDYLGGNGSRGYGKIKFKALDIEVVVGDLDDDIVDACREVLEEA